MSAAAIDDEGRRGGVRGKERLGSRWLTTGRVKATAPNKRTRALDTTNTCLLLASPVRRDALDHSDRAHTRPEKLGIS